MLEGLFLLYSFDLISTNTQAGCSIRYYIRPSFPYILSFQSLSSSPSPVFASENPQIRGENKRKSAFPSRNAFFPPPGFGEATGFFTCGSGQLGFSVHDRCPGLGYLWEREKEGKRMIFDTLIQEHWGIFHHSVYISSGYGETKFK